MQRLEFLKAFVEGRVSYIDWRNWLGVHANELQEDYGRTVFLRLKQKHRSYRQVRLILDEAAIDYDRSKENLLDGDEGTLSDFCEICGSKLFRAIPGQTTKEEIKTFARNSKIKDAIEVEREGWIHPGIYCPNGCTMVLINFRPVNSRPKD